MDRRQICKVRHEDRVLMCTYEVKGPAYSLDKSLPVSKRLAERTPWRGQAPG